MNVVRRSAAALAATAVIGTATPAVAATPSPSPSVAIPDGLYGTTDPTYDGVWRQSLALLAQRTVGVEPARSATDWLAGQQCANGAFAAFRDGKDAPCKADTNSTGAAVQALAEIGDYDAQVGKAVRWLKSVQNKDGGWGYFAGGASDANSTSVVIGALAQGGVTVPNLRKDGKSPYDALLKLALPCGGKDGGAFAYQPDKKGELTANADATAAAALGAQGETLAGSAQDEDDSAATCQKPEGPLPVQAGTNGAAWLAKTLAKDGHLTTALPGAEPQPDYGNTADAVVALSTSGLGDQAAKPLHWLESNAGAWAAKAGPAAYAQLIFAAAATPGGDVHDFGGEDLVAKLNATGPKPEGVDDNPTAGASDAKASSDTDDSDKGGLSAAWTVGGGLLIGALIGFALILRGRRRQQ
ncbi:prenyltransferase/squalene oxidase repeat-containing protein [Streptomyces sp. NPDC047081]|uniref:prenyltransferase/squalene oxidase repeat-containing protein n=1 Tax=Streptomyces sp. NPDC047081 TaxID=3154706 RepID=UPI0033CBB161